MLRNTEVRQSALPTPVPLMEEVGHGLLLYLALQMYDWSKSFKMNEIYQKICELYLLKNMKALTTIQSLNFFM